MSNPNEHKRYDREVRPEFYQDADGHTHTNVTRSSETVNNVPNPQAYRDGYIHGRVAENRYQEEVLVERDNENASRGLLMGILLTSLVALTAGAIWFFNQRNEEVPVTPTIVVPNSQPPSPSPEAIQPPESNRTIIERTREVPVLVPVPQQQAPAPQAPAPAPDIDITVPSPAPQAPATQQVPATQPTPTQPESQSNSPETQGTQNNIDPTTDTTTPAEGTSSQTDTTSGSTSSPAGVGNTGDSAQ